MASSLKSYWDGRTPLQQLNTMAIIIGIGIGLFAHLGIFIHGEWHIHAPPIFLFHLLLYAFLATGVMVSQCHGADSKLWTAGLIVSLCYLGTLLSSIFIYRNLFHRLTRAGFKGPFAMRVSKIFHVSSCRTSRNHLLLEGLQKQYGDFIRTGPSEITIFHPDVFVATDGPRTECVKSEWYDLLFPESSLLTTRARDLHDTRRRDWKECFSPQAQRHHFAKSVKHVEMLSTMIESQISAAAPCHMRDWFYWPGFDIVGDFVFNQSVDMLSNHEWVLFVFNVEPLAAL